MARAGRDLELTIKKLEECNLPIGAKINSPGFLIDRITGQSREVDILIEQKIGTFDIKIVIECRDRKSSQDTTWIEQLKTKFDDIKADRIIVVSSGKYTSQAIEKAKFYNIELRRLEEINSDLIKSWWKVEFVNLHFTQINIISAGVVIDDEPEDELPNIISKLDLNKEIFYSSKDDRFFSLNAIVTGAINGIANSWCLFHEPNKTFRKYIDLMVDPSDSIYFVEVEGEKYFISQINVVVDITFIQRNEPINRSAVYSNEKEELSYLIEYKNVVPGTDSSLEIIKNAQGDIKMRLRNDM
jgi:hypothetical protein